MDATGDGTLQFFPEFLAKCVENRRQRRDALVLCIGPRQDSSTRELNRPFSNLAIWRAIRESFLTSPWKTCIFPHFPNRGIV